MIIKILSIIFGLIVMYNLWPSVYKARVKVCDTWASLGYFKNESEAYEEIQNFSSVEQEKTGFSIDDFKIKRILKFKKYALRSCTSK